MELDNPRLKGDKACLLLMYVNCNDDVPFAEFKLRQLKAFENIHITQGMKNISKVSAQIQVKYY